MVRGEGDCAQTVLVRTSHVRNPTLMGQRVILQPFNLLRGITFTECAPHFQ